MEISIIGIGMGLEENLTVEAKKAIDNADLLIGASRMTKNYEGIKTIYNSYKPLEIKEIIDSQDKNSKIAVLMSGDIGFYSGAKKLTQIMNYEFKLIPGISSIAYFAAKLELSWQDAKLVSMHGTDCNIIGYIERYKKVFSLLSGKDQLKSIVDKLKLYGFDDIVVNVGQRLSYEDQLIFTKKVKDFSEADFNAMDNLLVVFFVNEKAVDKSLSYIRDEEFIRGEVPMTKSEIRSLSISRLNLKVDSIVYDLGAGTGSVAIEIAKKLLDGKVYAVEKEEKAVSLIKENRIKFAADNLEIIHGRAEEVIKDLPAPDAVFIGGSSGAMEEVVDYVFSKNDNATIVVNAISLNTVAEISQLISDRDLEADIAMVSVAKNKKVASHQLMMGLNPIYIFTIRMKGRCIND